MERISTENGGDEQDISHTVEHMLVSKLLVMICMLKSQICAPRKESRPAQVMAV
jgi:hypothetical protein